jgi:hypothetical protein
MLLLASLVLLEFMLLLTSMLHGLPPLLASRMSLVSMLLLQGRLGCWRP